jgi:hypothetical protein
MKDICTKIMNRRAVAGLSPENSVLLEILIVAEIVKTLPEFLSLLF